MEIPSTRKRKAFGDTGKMNQEMINGFYTLRNEIFVVKKNQWQQDKEQKDDSSEEKKKAKGAYVLAEERNKYERGQWVWFPMDHAGLGKERALQHSRSNH